MEVYRPEDAFGLILQTFKFYGAWPTSVKHPVLRLFYKIYGYVIHLLYVMTFLTTQVVQLFFTRSDLKELVDSSFFTMTCVAYVAKLLVFILRRKRVEEFFERLHEPIFAPKQKTHLEALNKCAITARNGSWTFFFLVMGACTNWIITPVVDSKQDKALIYTAWYPYNTALNPAYKYTFVFQTLFLLMTATMDAMIDMLTTNFYVVMVGQMEILKQEFRQLTDFIDRNKFRDASLQFSKTSAKSSQAIDINEKKMMFDVYDVEKTVAQDTFFSSAHSGTSVFYCNDKLLDEVLNNRITECTLRYQAVLKFVNDVTEFFQIGIAAQVCISSIIICTTTYEMTLISPASLQFYGLLQYQACMLFQVFIYSWRANDITLKATELKDAVYECGWVSVPFVKFRRSLCIIMSPLQIPLVIRVVKFFPLSVDTFFKILKMSYTFYILLKQLNTQNK